MAYQNNQRNSGQYEAYEQLDRQKSETYVGFREAEFAKNKEGQNARQSQFSYQSYGDNNANQKTQYGRITEDKDKMSGSRARISRVSGSARSSNKGSRVGDSNTGSKQNENLEAKNKK